MGSFVRPGPFVPLEDAQRQLLDALTPLAPRPTPIDDAAGRVLAREVVAPSDVPPFANAAMDGFALRSSDAATAPSHCSVIGVATAGAPFTGDVGPGQAVAIATGGALPSGADAVVRVEDTQRDGDVVTIEVPVDAGRFVRAPGSDLLAGTSVFGPGTVLGPAHVGVLASLGLDEVHAYPRVRVGVLATGDELVDLTDAPGPGQIHDANRHALLAAVRQSGCDAVDLGIVGDDPVAIGAALSGATERCDVVLSSGGVSVGTADHLQAVLDESSREPARWMEVRIKPGKPFGFALLEPSGLPVLCLPGNPVSAMVVFELLARPALRHLAGHRVAVRPALAATASARLEREPDGKVHYLRVVTHLDEDGALRVRPAGGQSSHQLHALAGSDALAIVPDGEGIEAGDPVRVLVLGADGPGLTWVDG